MQHYSQTIDELFSALSIEHDQMPDFKSWLDQFTHELSIQHCQLSIFYTLIEKSETYSLGNYSKVLNNPHILKWDFENTQVNLQFVFDEEDDNSEQLNKFEFLQPFIRSSLNLGIKHAEYQYLAVMQQSSYDMMQMGVFTLENNQVVNSNQYAQRLIESGYLSIIDHQIYINDQAISLNNQSSKTFNWKVGETRLQGHIFKHETPSTPWETQITRSWIIIKITSLRPSANWLTSLFQLSESQALVASYACQGLSAKEISRATKLTTHTVYSYLKAIYQKLGINNQAQLASVIWPRLPL